MPKLCENCGCDYCDGYRSAIEDVILHIRLLQETKMKIHQIEQADFNIVGKLLTALSTDKKFIGE